MVLHSFTSDMKYEALNQQAFKNCTVCNHSSWESGEFIKCEKCNKGVFAGPVDNYAGSDGSCFGCGRPWRDIRIGCLQNLQALKCKHCGTVVAFSSSSNGIVPVARFPPGGKLGCLPILLLFLAIPATAVTFLLKS